MIKIGIFNGKLGIAHITSLSQQNSEVTLEIKPEDLNRLIKLYPSNLQVQ